MSGIDFQVTESLPCPLSSCLRAQRFSLLIISAEQVTTHTGTQHRAEGIFRSPMCRRQGRAVFLPYGFHTSVPCPPQQKALDISSTNPSRYLVLHCHVPPRAGCIWGQGKRSHVCVLSTPGLWHVPVPALLPVRAERRRSQQCHRAWQGSGGPDLSGFENRPGTSRTFVFSSGAGTGPSGCSRDIAAARLPPGRRGGGAVMLHPVRSGRPRCTLVPAPFCPSAAELQLRAADRALPYLTRRRGRGGPTVGQPSGEAPAAPAAAHVPGEFSEFGRAAAWWDTCPLPPASGGTQLEHQRARNAVPALSHPSNLARAPPPSSP